MKLPKGWKSSQLSEISEIVRGSSPRPAGDPKFFDGEFLPWITVGEITKDERMFLTSTATCLTEEGARHTRILEIDTLLLTNSGATLGVPKITAIRAGANDGVAAFLRPIADKRFLYYFLQSKTPYFRGGLAPGVGQPNLNTELIGSVRIPLPPLPEQRKIADILTAWDEALEKLDTLITAKERRKKTLMQQLLAGKKRVKGFSTKSWISVQFGNLLRAEDRYVEFSDERTYRLVSIRRRSGGVFFREALNGNDIKTKVMKKVQCEDFLISRMQVVHGALGMVRENCDGFYASDSYEVLVAKDSTKLHMPFLDWMSRQRSFWYLTYICSHGVHIEKMTFNLEDFMHERITIPADIEEQRQIAAILDTCDKELRLLRAQRTALDQQKRGLMQRLLTGKVRVRGTNTRTGTHGQ